jgi:hypothetical protein
MILSGTAHMFITLPFVLSGCQIQSPTKRRALTLTVKITALMKCRVFLHVPEFQSNLLPE